MKLNATLALLLLMLLAFCHDQKNNKANPSGINVAMACLPRIGQASGRPFFWGLFGQSGGGTDNDDNESDQGDVDEKTMQQTQWTTVGDKLQC